MAVKSLQNKNKMLAHLKSATPKHASIKPELNRTLLNEIPKTESSNPL